MNEATPEPQRCEVCGARLWRGNTTGICGDSKRTACARERARRTGVAMIFITAGDTFGKWTALESGRSAYGRTLRRCECGTEKPVINAGLVRGRSKSCGCNLLAASARRFPNPYIPARTVFGRLTVLDDAPRALSDVRCACECGTETTLTAASLKAGRTRSCGCLRRDVTSKRGGVSKHPLYRTWYLMIDRCTNPKNDSYSNYGGRGVKVCERWLDPWLFIEDVEREIGLRPEGKYPSGIPLYSFDRVRNEFGYGPGNVRWSTQSEQVLNQRKVATLTRERDALAAKVAELEARLIVAEAEVATLRRRARKRAVSAQDQAALF